MNILRYKKGYKYQLKDDFRTIVHVKPEQNISFEYASLDTDGNLFVKSGYAWDGCSGPTIDDKTNMRAGLIHDVLYQMMRLGLLDQSYKDLADKELYRFCLVDGMCKIRALYYFKGVQKFGYGSCKLQNEVCTTLVFNDTPE